MSAKKLDFPMLGAIAAIVIFGIVMLASASAKISQEKFGTTYYYLNHQLLYGLLPGLILGFIACRVNIKLIKKWAPIIFVLNLILMTLVFFPKIGVSAGGAARWVDIGPITFQPAEFLKLSMIIYLASWLSNRAGKKSQNRASASFYQTFLPFFATLAIIALLFYFQPDISTFVIIASTSIIMYFLAGTPLFHTVLLILSGIGTILFCVFNATYRQNRLNVFFNPQIDPMGIGYQIKQALIAVGSGGLFGIGLGMSGQKYGFLPESMSDSIFAILAEETGFLGCLILIALFLFFFWRGFKIGKNSKDIFSKLAVFGITSWILIQTLSNISSMTGILPLAGIPLPYFSYGGSALVTELVAAGILLNVSRKT